MARIRIAYIGGGSTRAPGTAAALVERADAFAGSELVLVDVDAEHLEVVRRPAERMAAAAVVILAGQGRAIGEIAAAAGRQVAIDRDRYLLSFCGGLLSLALRAGADEGDWRAIAERLDATAPSDFFETPLP